jgi:hypothetical protein
MPPLKTELQLKAEQPNAETTASEHQSVDVTKSLQLHGKDIERMMNE